jgi:methyltransferase-like protein
VAAGRTVLEFLQSSLASDDSPYSALLAAEVSRVIVQNDASLHRLFFQETPRALYFREFAQAARAHELRVLGDVGFALGYSDYLSQPMEQLLNSLCADHLGCEQYRDLVRNRGQRQSVLCRFEVPIDFRLSTTRLRGLFVEGLLRLEDHSAPIVSATQQTFIAADGSTVSTAVPSVKVALSAIGANWPNYLRFEDVAAEAAHVIAEAAQAEAAKSKSAAAAEFDESAEVLRVEHDLLPCCRQGLVQVHGAPQAFVAEPGERPAASPLARRQAAAGDIVTNRKHQAIRLDHFDRLVVRLLDGTRTMSELVEFLAGAVASGQMAAIENNQPVPEQRLPTFLRDSLEHSLRRLGDSAVLIA